MKTHEIKQMREDILLLKAKLEHQLNSLYYTIERVNGNEHDTVLISGDDDHTLPEDYQAQIDEINNQLETCTLQLIQLEHFSYIGETNN